MASDLQSIYDELKQKITGERLKDISAGIIARYREKKYEAMIHYADLLGISRPGESVARLFAVIQVYHPDRFVKIHRDINEEYGFAEVITEVLLGDMDITLTATDLRGLDGEIDMSDYDFSDLGGIENCVNIIAMNLSGNRIEKIHPLAELTKF